MKDINLKSPSRREYFLIHGYTGSPDDFNGLPEYLHQIHKANVRVLLLKGHGTFVQDLDNLYYQDFFNQIDKALRHDINQGKEIIVGGTSFGGQLALILAARYPVKGVFAIGVPYKLKFPFNVPGIERLAYKKKYWKKILFKDERRLRKNSFYYQYIHINALQITEAANAVLKESLPQITCPLLIIHSKKDPVASVKSASLIHQQVTAKYKKIILFSNRRHSLFFTDKRFSLYKAIESFFETNTK